MRKQHFYRILGGSLIAMAWTMAVPAQAADNGDSENAEDNIEQNETAEDASGEEGIIQGETIVVTGTRARGREELNKKVERDVVSDSLSQDEIAAVPDFNVADALRRIPGVAAEFDEDEGRFVNVRGIDANLNYVTFDGIGVPSSGSFGGGGRNVNIEFFPSTAVKRLDVYKTFTPDMDGSSIGGYVDVVTRSAFDSDDPTFLVARVTGSYFTANDIAEDSDEQEQAFRLESTFSQRFGAEDEFGIVLTGLYGQRPREQDRLFTVGGIENRFDNVTPPTRFDSSLTSNNQERYGGNGKFEYSKNDVYASVGGYFYRQQENEVRYRNNLRFSANDLIETGPDQAQLANGRMELNFDDFPIRTQGFGVQGHFEALIGDRVNFDADIGWAEQNFDHDTPALVFRTPFVPELGVDIDASTTVPTRSTFNDPSYFRDPENYALSFIRQRDLNTDEQVLNALMNIGYNNLAGDRGFGFKTGIAYRNLERVRDNEEFRFSADEFNELSANTSLAPLLANDNFTSDYSPDAFLFYDGQAVNAFFDSLNIPRDDRRSTTPDFNYEEDIIGAYGMVTYRTDNLDIIAGVRYEHTDFRAGAQAEVQAVSGSFDNFLPSINVKWELANNLFLRGAYSRTLGRPNPNDLAVTTIDTPAEETDEGIRRIRRGNPDLQPRISDNFDLSLEYYFNNGEGLLSAAIFRKEIDGDIFFTETEGELDGEPVIFAQNTNASNSMVQGLELQAYVGTMPFLPPVLQGLGFSGNVTFLDGETTFLDGTTLDRRIRQADLIANASLFYNTGDFEARVVYNYTDDFLIRANRTDDGFEQIDASLRYYITDNFLVSLEGRNLTNSRRRQWTGENFDLLFGETIIGRQFHLGLTFRY
ncbi:TonB-dependent receptor [Alterisphingorhabdus coralli]|uniref:TonB-dependent receptor n=1 Tax=Alterisphingorhabdus coralli TaxID=3071408 RepID=A0AA97I1A9_9SPHN|nr:TonB-dependent receptor [Parasphingorhabdus sp. SCSIO 66989]WOE75198.1 TonB-dependent receptor [Parasphingorhabdus sp. SCSIO 66989]